MGTRRANWWRYGGVRLKRAAEEVSNLMPSDKWQEHIKLKENKKLELQKQKEERKLMRQMRKEEKEIVKSRNSEKKELKKKEVSKKNNRKKKKVAMPISTSEDEDFWKPSGDSADDYSIFGVEICDLELNGELLKLPNMTALVGDEPKSVTGKKMNSSEVSTIGS